MKKNVLIGQSGGPTAVINATLYGAVREVLKNEDSFGTIYGMINGTHGFINGKYIDLKPLAQKKEFELVKNTPGAYLGSCRYKLPNDFKDPFYPKFFNELEKLNIGYFFYIGGNDSMDTVSKLSRYAAAAGVDIKMIGLPKTIDNDVMGTDHTPGFGSAAKFVANSVREIVLDASSYSSIKTVTIVEIMGRNAGWLTAASVLARKFKKDEPSLIYLPEKVFDSDIFIEKVRECLDAAPNPVICVSEGLRDKSGRLICESEKGAVDAFGHKALTGAGKYLENLVKSYFNIKVRSVELSLLQRCSSAMISKTDQDEATASAVFGVNCALKGETGKMIGFRRLSNDPYKSECVTFDADKVCNLEKPFPPEWIIKDGTDISDEFLPYIKPLISGEVQIPFKDSLHDFAYIRK